MSIEIEITDSVSAFIPSPNNTEQCDNCHHWVKESKIVIVGELFLCDKCRPTQRAADAEQHRAANASR